MTGKKRKRRDAEAEAEGAGAAAAAATGSTAEPAAAAPAAEAEAAAGGHTLFVKNVAWATSEEGLREMFTAVGPVRTVRIPTRRNPKHRPGDALQPEHLSMGYAFVEFRDKDAAGRALRTLQGKVLDGHALQLKVSHSGGGKGGAEGEGDDAAAAPAAKKARKDGGAAAASAGVAAPGGAKLSVAQLERATKLVVRNLAFEATKRDISELFASFGQVKSIRIPKRADGRHRGFAFVDFLTHAEAAAAMDALAATHLYGRHLVLEYAAADEAAAGAGGDAAAAQ
jgi:multiple RNA-binding domain-containing protein 1